MKSYEENGMCIRRGEIEHNSLCRRRRHNSSSGWSYTYSWALGGGGEEFFIATICCCCESVILLHSGFLSSVNLLGISIMNFIVKSTGFSCRMFLLDFILMAVQIHVLSHMSCLHPPLVSVLSFHLRKSSSLCSFCLPQFITGLCCSGNNHWGDSLIILCCSMCHLYRCLLFSSITLRREERQRGWIIRQWIGTGTKTGSK